uniref:Transcriptional regulator n=1 Tax=uncultured bacterium 20 TaxID=1748270 RepID=A0A0U3T2M3_9BACT|nr:transcriptional regulator [uncultured bacterium 20]
MHSKGSKLAAVRKKGATQVDAQRTNILDAAERRFLQLGLEHTTMADIAEQAGITRMTLYRYFRDRDTIAFEIAGRMLQRVISINIPASGGERDWEARLLVRLKDLALAMIRDFDALRDAYRYLGMFDRLYADRYPTEELATWYKQHMQAIWYERHLEGLPVSGVSEGVLAPEFPYGKHVLMTMNAVMSFLQRMAARGELMAAEQGVPLQDQLNLFDEMIGMYFDRLIASLPRTDPPTDDEDGRSRG